MARKLPKRALDRRGRVKQVLRWLRKEYVTPYPVSVRWVPRLAQDPDDLQYLTKREAEAGIYGLCTQKGKRFVISLSLRRNRTVSEAIDTLLHEYAHAVSTRHAKVETRRVSGHDDEFWLTHGRIYRRFIEDGGWEESCR